MRFDRVTWFWLVMALIAAGLFVADALYAKAF